MNQFILWVSQLLAALRLVWEKIPKPLRTIINVCVGAGFAAVVQQAVTGGDTSFDALLLIFLTAAGTALWRMINPADTSYGIGKGVTTEVLGAHEIPPPPADVVEPEGDGGQDA